jgi:hypothetical protein
MSDTAQSKPAEAPPLTPDELQYAPADLSDLVLNPKPRMTPYGEQDDNGVDVSLIRRNLQLSPLERAMQGARLAKQAKELRAYGKRRVR